MFIEKTDRIGGIIPKNKVTLLTGLPGSGKSFTISKFLNENNIVPLYFNLDPTELGELNTRMYGGEDLLALLNAKNDFTDLKDSVVVIDTYIRMESLLSGMFTKDGIVALLEEVIERYNITIIVIGHPEDYVGKDSIFKDNPTLVRNCYEHIHIEKKNQSSTRKGVTEITQSIITYITKGRGYTGERAIVNWMRD